MDWRKLERHPISARYPDLKGRPWEDFKENMTRRKIRGRFITLHDGQILDGWQLYRACLELDIEPKFVTLRAGEDPDDFVEEANDHRRHESPEMMDDRAEVRRERVVQARMDGKSVRAIAEAEGVSVATVHNDIQASGVHPEHVEGKDGKEYPASKPKVYCTHCETLMRKTLEPKRNCPMCAEARKTGKKKEPKKRDEPSEKTDAFGTVIPKRCLDAYCDPWIQEAIDFIGTTLADFRGKRLADGLNKRKKHYPWFNHMDFIDGVGFVDDYLEELLKHLKDFRPAGVCPCCEGKGCAECKMSGLVPRSVHKTLKAKK